MEDVGFGHSRGFLFRPEGLIKISLARPPLVATDIFASSYISLRGDSVRIPPPLAKT